MDLVFLITCLTLVQRVFPEAAAENKVDHNLGLSSDDSDDGDYNPDVAEDEEVEGGKSSSDESENSSASEEMEVSHSEDPYLGLPSEDSEDDDFDPNAADHDKDVTEESSISDFTSDSEDLANVIKVNTFSGQDNDPISASSLLELDPGQEASTPVSGRRHIERLDYKKLYDVSYLSWFMNYSTIIWFCMHSLSFLYEIDVVLSKGFELAGPYPHFGWSWIFKFCLFFPACLTSGPK